MTASFAPIPSEVAPSSPASGSSRRPPERDHPRKLRLRILGTAEHRARNWVNPEIAAPCTRPTPRAARPMKRDPIIPTRRRFRGNATRPELALGCRASCSGRRSSKSGDVSGRPSSCGWAVVLEQGGAVSRRTSGVERKGQRDGSRDERRHLLGRGLRFEALTIAWNVAEAASAIFFGSGALWAAATAGRGRVENVRLWRVLPVLAPAAIVPPRSPHVKKILVALDGSPRADGVLAYAVSLARLTGAKLVLFRSFGIPPEMTLAWPASDEPLESALRKQAQTYLDELRRRGSERAAGRGTGRARRSVAGRVLGCRRRERRSHRHRLARLQRH